MRLNFSHLFSCELFQKLWRIWDIPLHLKVSFHNLMDAVKKHKTPGPETKDSLFLAAKAVAKYHYFYTGSWAVIAKQQDEGQMISAYKVVCITGEEHWV